MSFDGNERIAKCVMDIFIWALRRQIAQRIQDSGVKLDDFYTVSECQQMLIALERELIYLEGEAND